MGWDLISGRVWFCQVGQGVVSFGISFLGGYLYIFWVYKCFKACDTLSKGRSTLYNHSTISFYKKYLSTIHSHHFLLRMSAKCLQKEQQHHSNCRTGKWQRKMNKMNSSSMVMKWSNNGKPPRRATGRDIAVEMTGSADIAIHRMLWPHVVWRWVLAVPLSAHKYLALLPVFFLLCLPPVVVVTVVRAPFDEFSLLGWVNAAPCTNYWKLYVQCLMCGEHRFVCKLGSSNITIISAKKKDSTKQNH